ncbi:hypothetical protein [Mesorhizobium sp.]|uniref:hypothetical protein n=1 Tax=Mesorhizobium sp. TaxID=1871066 RepID=UPI000FE518B4|nr:hypothetical protein [Mesorhizobium sp.]RWF33742.1 MAG: hypothetical protein EOS45_02085 [Mesorhizobium sp.]
MNITVTISWWAFPLVVTIGMFIWTFAKPMQPSSGYGVDIMPLIRFGVSAIISLAAWLVWALLT